MAIKLNLVTDSVNPPVIAPYKAYVLVPGFVSVSKASIIPGRASTATPEELTYSMYLKLLPSFSRSNLAVAVPDVLIPSAPVPKGETPTRAINTGLPEQYMLIDWFVIRFKVAEVVV